MKKIITFLLAILTFFMFSCNNVKKDTGKDPQTTPETDTDTAAPSNDTEPIDTADCDDHPWGNYTLQYGDLVILEIGEICGLEYVPSENQPEYVGVGVNIIKDFEGALETRYNYKGNHQQRMSFVNEEMREKISDEYGDVILIESSMIDEIPVGTTVFAPLNRKSLEGVSSKESVPFYEIRPLSLFSERNTESIYGCERVLEVMYVIDGKISIPERIKKGSGLNYLEGNMFIYALEEANENLIKVGRENLLFHDGMTVDELERYIRAASNEVTFRSLYEND